MPRSRRGSTTEEELTEALGPEDVPAITWVTQFTDRSFVGTGSRLRTLLDPLDELALALDTDADRRVADSPGRRASVLR